MDIYKCHSCNRFYIAKGDDLRCGCEYAKLEVREHVMSMDMINTTTLLEDIMNRVPEKQLRLSLSKAVDLRKEEC